MIFACCDDRRRSAVQAHAMLNGIDFLEVQDDPGDADELRQRTLYVHFIKELPPGGLGTKNVRIEGGERVRVQVTAAAVGSLVSPPDSPPTGDARVLIVDVAEPGDFSTYTLRLVDYEPALVLDPLLASIDFSFKVACPGEFDWWPSHVCTRERGEDPELNYLAKDYASFRRLMLDRMSALMPHWNDRNPADIGVALVELLAYVGDQLSYQQDAIATEAYLGTARRRTSLRRHARLVDYRVHEGSNARAWVQVQVADGTGPLLLEYSVDGFVTRFITRERHVPAGLRVLRPDSPELRTALQGNPEQFELVEHIELHVDHNRMRFYTWGAQECCLPRGATHATLRGALPGLVLEPGEPGRVLILMEARGPETGVVEDADPARRHAVRLTSARVSADPLGGRFEDTPTDDPVAVTEIEWGDEDALPFALCVSSEAFEDVSVALGNIALVDHGVTVAGEALPDVPLPDPALARVPRTSGAHCTTAVPRVARVRYGPVLQQHPLTHAPEYGLGDPLTSASEVMQRRDKVPQPAVTLRDDSGAIWRPLPDLLASGPESTDFVVEVESDGSAHLRFGDGTFGQQPGLAAVATDQPWARATYRVGNGPAGNVGRETIAHLVSADAALGSDVIERVWNPLPARGGSRPESLEHIRQRAPGAFRVQERAVTAKDYQDVVARARLGVQRSAATFRWTGSWRTVFLSADRLGGKPVDPAFGQALTAAVEPFRMAGMDLEVEAPRFVSLEITMRVCVEPAYFREQVEEELSDLFSSGRRRDGRKGLFHPDHFTFGQPVHLSPLIAAAQGVEGVEFVRVTQFRRFGQRDARGLEDGRLELGRLEVARLDNDRSFPERGLLRLRMEGGR